MYYYFIPKLKWKKIKYIKKNKKEAEEEENLAAIAKNKNISKRELKEYIKNYE